MVLRDIGLLGGRLQGRISGLVYCYKDGDDTGANERTNDGTDVISTMGTPARAARANCTHAPNMSPTSGHSKMIDVDS